MKTYKVVLVSDLDVVKRVVDYQNKHNISRRWCVHDDISEFDIRVFHHPPYKFNPSLHIYRQLLTTPNNPLSLTTIQSYIAKQHSMVNIVTMYIIFIFENDTCVDSVAVMVDKNGKYYKSYSKHAETDGWPDEIPVVYQQQCTYLQTTYPSHDIFKSKLYVDLKAGMIFFNGKQLINNKMYKNETDVCEFDWESNTLTLHIPFNVCYISDYNHYISKYKPSLIKIVTDDDFLHMYYDPVVIGYCEVPIVNGYQINNIDKIDFSDKDNSLVSVLKYDLETFYNLCKNKITVMYS